MSFFSEMFSPRKDPNKRLSSAPNQIRPVTTYTGTDWGPAPTGYYPDRNPEQQGVVLPPPDWDPFNSPSYEPTGSPGGRQLPAQYVSSEQIDQHVFLQVSGTETAITASQGTGRPTGQFDPQTDGPGAPTPRLLSMWYYRGSGNTRTKYMDVPDGRTFSATGTQDGSSTTWYQSTQAAMAPYNVDPALYDPKHPERSTDMPDSLSAIPAGRAHGWSEIPVAPGNILARNQDKKRKHQQYVGQNRLANSTYAGQTYSQSTRHVRNPPGASATINTTPMSNTPGGIA